MLERMNKRQENMEAMSKLAYERKFRMKKNPTKAEITFKEILNKYKIPIQFQKVIFTPSMFYIIDFLFRKGKNKCFIFEIDGDTHNKEYDDKRTSDILSMSNYRKCKVIRFKNEQVYNGEAEEEIIKLFPRFTRKRAQQS